MSCFSVYLPDEQAMLAFGGQLAKAWVALDMGLVIFLNGDLGVGKTTLSRGVLRGLGYAGAVKSPTYTLVEPYEFSNKIVYHFDLYRLGDPEELEYMGIRDYFLANSLCLIEWPERGDAVLPEPDVVLSLKAHDSGRLVAAQAPTLKGQQVLAALRELAGGLIVQTEGK